MKVGERCRSLEGPYQLYRGAVGIMWRLSKGKDLLRIDNPRSLERQFGMEGCIIWRELLAPVKEVALTCKI
jgi:hypothetical protein